jgi:hypothetical protein
MHTLFPIGGIQKIFKFSNYFHEMTGKVIGSLNFNDRNSIFHRTEMLESATEACLRVRRLDACDYLKTSLNLVFQLTLLK